jgi:hypothetical protein
MSEMAVARQLAGLACSSLYTQDHLRILIVWEWYQYTKQSDHSSTVQDDSAAIDVVMDGAG